jgi:hypothetical protein
MSEQPTAPAAGGGNMLTRKYAGIPGYFWLAGAALVVYLLLRSRSSSSSGATGAGNTPNSNNGTATDSGSTTINPPNVFINAGTSSVPKMQTKRHRWQPGNTNPSATPTQSTPPSSGSSNPTNPTPPPQHHTHNPQPTPPHKPKHVTTSGQVHGPKGPRHGPTPHVSSHTGSGKMNSGLSAWNHAARGAVSKSKGK